MVVLPARGAARGREGWERWCRWSRWIARMLGEKRRRCKQPALMHTKGWAPAQPSMDTPTRPNKWPAHMESAENLEKSMGRALSTLTLEEYPGAVYYVSSSPASLLHLASLQPCILLGCACPARRHQGAVISLPCANRRRGRSEVELSRLHE